MKQKLFYLLSFFCLLLAAGCSDDNESTGRLSQTEFKAVSHEGGICTIDISADGFAWKAVSEADWCHLNKLEGVGNYQLAVEVDANLGEARTCQVLVSVDGVDYNVAIEQDGLPEGQELKYRIPVVFHVIYGDKNDPKQNIPADEIYEMLDKVNALYRNAGASTAVDLNMEFVAAEYDPQGNRLAEPGIDRVQWVSSELDPIDVMNDRTRKYVHFLWEPNDYVNILIYRFAASSGNVLGISTFPYTTESHPMDGTDVLEDMDITLENLNYVRGVSINNAYLGNREDAMAPFAPDKELMNKQVAGYITVAHELGHYFGLRHTFCEVSEGCLDTDFCQDTPSYDKTAYDAFVNQVYQYLVENPEAAATFDWESIFDRSRCDGETFVSHNIMDYAYSYLDEFTADQRIRVRHVLDYSPMIPGPKRTRAYLKSRTAPKGAMNLPFSVSDCGPRALLGK